MESSIVVIGYEDILEELIGASKTRGDWFKIRFKIIFIGIEFSSRENTHQMVFVERDFHIGHTDVFTWAKIYVKDQHSIELDERSVKGGGRLEVDASDLNIKNGGASALFGTGPDWIYDTLMTKLKNEDQLREWKFD